MSIYRGYDIEELTDGGFVIKKDGEVKAYPINLDAAYLWVDGAKATEHKAEYKPFTKT